MQQQFFNSLVLASCFSPGLGDIFCLCEMGDNNEGRSLSLGVRDNKKQEALCTWPAKTRLYNEITMI